MARKTKEDTERTHHALLDAATELFIRQGVARTTLGQIAAEAGMTRGAVYWHFQNKDAVIEALWLRNTDWLHRMIDELPERIRPSNPAGSFRTAVRQLMRGVTTRPELAQILRIVMHNVEYSEEETELQRFLTTRKEGVHLAMEKAFKVLRRHGAVKAAGSPALLADCLLSYLHGLIHNYLSPEDRKVDLRKHGDAALDYMLDSLLVDDS